MYYLHTLCITKVELGRTLPRVIRKTVVASMTTSVMQNMRNESKEVYMVIKLQLIYH